MNRPSVASRLSVFAVLAGGFFAFAGCDSGAKVLVTVGPVDVDVSSSEVALPSELRDSSGDAPVLASFPCGPSIPCPMLDPGAGFALVCEAEVCDPSPKNLDVPVGDVLDLEEYGRSYGWVSQGLKSVTIDEIRVMVSRNTLSFALPALQISWGPENSTAFDASRRLGTMPAVSAGSTNATMVDLDDDGVAGLSEHLLRTSKKFRLFGRTAIDLEPGGPFPEGALELSVAMDVTIESKGLSF